MKSPRFTLVADGPTDGQMLVPILEWLLRVHCPAIGIRVEFADTRGRQTGPGLHGRIAFAIAGYPCDCLFIHRDAEREPAEHRRGEIGEAVGLLGASRPGSHISVIPVRMTEAWLLFDEPAIRVAANNPNGKVRLDLPRPKDVESLPDPKKLLYDLLTTASELPGRRRKSFDPKKQIHLIARLIDDFSPLHGLSAFQALERDVHRLVRERGWDEPG